MIKKLISAALALAVILPSAMPASAADSKTDYRYINMTELGIISSDEDTDYIVTRGEFASVICGLFGMSEDEAEEYAVSFSDLDAGDDDYTSIKRVVAMKLFSGFPDLTFRSREAVTVEQALKVVASAAGFAEEAEARGGFPKGYIAVAKSAGLLKKTGISSYKSNIKRSELAGLLFNLLITPVNEMYAADGDTVYYAQGDKTFAEKYLNLTYTTDILEANDYTNLSETVTTGGDDCVVIDGEVLKVHSHSDRFLVGRWVSAFYDTDTLEIASIAERTEDEEELVLDAKDITSLAADEIGARVNGNRKTYKIPADASWVYNDKYVMSYDLTQLKDDKSYRITLLDNDGSGRYDIVFVEDYTTVVTARKNGDKEIFDKLSDSLSVSLSDDNGRKVLLYDTDGKTADFEDIAENTVVTAIENAGYVRAVISKSLRTDTVHSIGTDGNKSIAECEADTYFIGAQLEKWLSENNIIGRKVKFYLDSYGDIAYIILSDDTGEVCGYLVRAWIASDEVTTTMLLKIFTADGEMKRFEATAKVKVNGTTYRPEDMSDVPQELSGAKPVLYTVTEGKINKLVTPKSYLSSNEDGLFKGVSVKNKNIAINSNIFGGVIEADRDTIAFIIPSDTSDEEAYEVKKGSSYESRLYDIDAYYTSKDSAAADVLVITSNINTLTYEEPVAVIVKTVKEYYKDEICKRVTYFCRGSEHTAYLRDKTLPQDIATGDAVRIKVDDVSGEIANIEHIYDCSEEKYKLGSNPTYADYNASLRIGMGYIARVYSGRIRVSPVPVYKTDSSSFALEVHRLSLYDVIIVDTEEGAAGIYAGEEADIDVGDRVVYVTRSGGGKALVIYK